MHLAIRGSGEGTYNLLRMGCICLYPMVATSLSSRRTTCVLTMTIQDNKRPFAPLHGIATGPVQGADHKRWRLMMMYQDHSILSYELCRRSARDSAVDVASLVV